MEHQTQCFDIICFIAAYLLRMTEMDDLRRTCGRYCAIHSRINVTWQPVGRARKHNLVYRADIIVGHRMKRQGQIAWDFYKRCACAAADGHSLSAGVFVISVSVTRPARLGLPQ